MSESFDNEAASSKHPRRWRIVGGVALVALVFASTALLTSGGSDAATSSDSISTTVTVSERDLVARESFDGTLGYGDPITISAGSSSASTGTTTGTSSGGASGASSGTQSSSSSSSGSESETLTVTSTAAEGQIVNQGEVLFALNTEPTVLLYGTTPLYRELSTSSKNGADVLQLETDLVALGLDPGTVDEEFTSATASAVEAWEEALGRENPDGVVGLGEVVFAPAAVRVSALEASVGEVVASSSPVLQITATLRIVTVELDARRQDLVKPGDAVEVTFSNGESVEGTIETVSKVASAPESEGTGTTAGSSTEEATVPVTIALPDDPKVPDFDQAPVTVGITQEQRQQALAVPVTALLALTEGGYGLEVVGDDGKTTIVAVETGVYADGFVEVSSDEISAGTKVVNA